jgi:hypothetical protein
MAKDPGEVDPSQLHDTVADEEVAPEEGPEAAATPPPAPRRAPPDFDRKWHPEQLQETMAEGPAIAGGRRKSDNDVDLSRIFDRLTGGEQEPVARYDPEAGRTNVAVKISAATEAMAQAVKGVASSAIYTPFGRLILSTVIALAGISLAIAAVTIQDTWMIVAAALVCPLGLFLVYSRYQAWLGHKRYMYRLLETLGEDVSEFDPGKRFRRIQATAIKKGRRR